MFSSAIEPLHLDTSEGETTSDEIALSLRLQYPLCDNQSLLSVASDSTKFSATEDISRHSAASGSYATNYFGSRPIVSIDGKCGVVQVSLYGATEPHTFACFSDSRV